MEPNNAATSPNKRVSGYGATHLRPNPRFARTSDTRRTLYAIQKIFF